MAPKCRSTVGAGGCRFRLGWSQRAVYSLSFPRGFGWSEVKHPKALQLHRMWAVRGWLDRDGR